MNEGLRTKLHRLSLLALGGGCVGGAIAWFAAPAASDDLFADQAGSKRYLHDLEVFGGRANVLQDQLQRWFAGLWHGRQLATTLVTLGVVVFVAIQLVLDQSRVGSRGAEQRKSEPR